jgi:hypothetical protein
VVQAARTKAVVPVLEAAKRALLLSGTPFLSKPAELFPQLRGLLPGAKLKYGELAERYCVGNRWNKFAGCKNEEELNALLVRPAGVLATLALAAGCLMLASWACSCIVLQLLAA